jgi:hypothetical protein
VIIIIRDVVRNTAKKLVNGGRFITYLLLTTNVTNLKPSRLKAQEFQHISKSQP